jgi:hypothetical protein
MGLQATPAFAGSPDPTPATPVLTNATYAVTAGSLGGSTGLTGWTGPRADQVFSGSPATSSSSGVVPGTVTDTAGFLSESNTDIAGTTIRVDYSFPVETGVTYSVSLSVYTAHGRTQAQLVDIDLLGAGVIGGLVGGATTTVGRFGGGYYNASTWPHLDYVLMSDQGDAGSEVKSVTITPTFASTAAGQLTVRFTFTFTTAPAEPQTTDLDMWVAQPVVLPVTG